MNVSTIIKYGKRNLKFRTGSGALLGILYPENTVSNINEKKIIENSIAEPVKSKSIDNFLNQNDRVLVVIPDKTRLCRIKIVLPLILNILRAKKIRKENISIIFANGSHAEQGKEEIKKIIGARIYSSYNVYENNAFDKEAHAFFGRTKAGNRVYLNNILSSVDKIITIGAVVHHYFAGFGGGAKLIMPGLGYYETIRENHRKTILKTGEMNPECRTANLKNNPVYEEIAEVIKFIPPVFSVCLVLNEKGKIINAKSGNIVEAHKQAAKSVDKYYKIKIKKKSDLVIVSAGGYPKDIDFIQSHKSIQNAFQAVNENGIIIALAECPDGIGSKTFLEWFNYKNEKEFKKQLLKNYTLNAQTALSLKTKLKHVKIILISSLPDDIIQKMGLMSFKKISDALNYAENKLGSKYSYYIIKNGSLVVPEFT
jgi:lactate racemase